MQPREHLFVENAALFQSLGKPLARLIEDEGAGHALPVVAARLPVVHPVDDLGRLMATLDTGGEVEEGDWNSSINIGGMDNLLLAYEEVTDVA